MSAPAPALRPFPITPRRRVAVVVSIDTECDKGPGWKTQFPLRFRSVTEGIPSLLTPLFRKHQIVPTYLISPEILRDERCVEVLRGLTDCELGTHLHGEFIEPEAAPDAAVTSTPQLAYAPDVERRKLENLTDLFEARLGHRPLSFRAGRFALSTHTLGFLERLGYRVDSSVTPFRTNEYANGLRCNYWGAPLSPYRPSARDPRRRGSLRLLEVPVTIFAPRLAKLPAFLLRRLSDRLVKSRPIRTLVGGPVERMWIRPLRGRADQLASWSDAVIAGWGYDTIPVLNVMFHSVEATPGASPYVQTEKELAGFLADLEHLFAHLRANYDLVPVGLGTLSRELAS